MILLVFNRRSFGHNLFRSYEVCRQVPMARGIGAPQYGERRGSYETSAYDFFSIGIGRAKYHSVMLSEAKHL